MCITNQGTAVTWEFFQSCTYLSMVVDRTRTLPSPLSLVGAATSIYIYIFIYFLSRQSFVTTNMCLSRQNTSFVATKVCLSQQNIFVATKLFTTICRDKQFCRDKRDKTRLLLRQNYASIIFVATNTCCRDKSFVTTNIILSRQTFCRDKNDTCGSSRQLYSLRSVLPVSVPDRPPRHDTPSPPAERLHTS